MRRLEESTVVFLQRIGIVAADALMVELVEDHVDGLRQLPGGGGALFVVGDVVGIEAVDGDKVVVQRLHQPVAFDAQEIGVGRRDGNLGEVALDFVHFVSGQSAFDDEQFVADAP